MTLCTKHVSYSVETTKTPRWGLSQIFYKFVSKPMCLVSKMIDVQMSGDYKKEESFLINPTKKGTNDLIDEIVQTWKHLCSAPLTASKTCSSAVRHSVRSRHHIT